MSIMEQIHSPWIDVVVCALIVSAVVACVFGSIYSPSRQQAQQRVNDYYAACKEHGEQPTYMSVEHNRLGWYVD